MSKTFRSFLPIVPAFVLILFNFSQYHSQEIEATIRIDSKTAKKIVITGKIFSPQASKNLSFLVSYGSIFDLGARFSNVEVFDRNGKAINTRRTMAGEYLADRPFEKFSYQIDLTPLKQTFAAAHVSWLDKEGILMLDDLLPQLGKKTSAKIRFDMSSDLMFATNEDVAEPITSPVTFKAEDVRKAVFYIYSKNANRYIRSATDKITLDFLGDWPFNSAEAGYVAEEIYEEYGRFFSGSPSGDILIGLRKFPRPIPGETWEADSRGRTITIISSDSTIKSQSLQRFHEQLRHEMFHLWIPNGVNLSGNYDWFYEGFALYQSLKMGVALNRMRFDDYLDTLSHAYDVDRGQALNLSLIDVSKNRWVGNNNKGVYARGMLVAFLCDLVLLDKSKGKRSTTNLLRQLYERHRPPAAEMDGNAAVLNLLRSYSELAPIIDGNISGSKSIEWNDLLKAAGLEVEEKDQTTKLKVTAKPSGRQKDLLDKLGYNNWRKLASK